MRPTTFSSRAGPTRAPRWRSEAATTVSRSDAPDFRGMRRSRSTVRRRVAFQAPQRDGQDDEAGDGRERRGPGPRSRREQAFRQERDERVDQADEVDGQDGHEGVEHDRQMEGPDLDQDRGQPAFREIHENAAQRENHGQADEEDEEGRPGRGSGGQGLGAAPDDVEIDQAVDGQGDGDENEHPSVSQSSGTLLNATISSSVFRGGSRVGLFSA